MRLRTWTMTTLFLICASAQANSFAGKEYRFHKKFLWVIKLTPGVQGKGCSHTSDTPWCEVCHEVEGGSQESVDLTQTEFFSIRDTSPANDPKLATGEFDLIGTVTQGPAGRQTVSPKKVHFTVKCEGKSAQKKAGDSLGSLFEVREAAAAVAGQGAAQVAERNVKPVLPDSGGGSRSPAGYPSYPAQQVRPLK